MNANHLAESAKQIARERFAHPVVPGLFASEVFHDVFAQLVLADVFQRLTDLGHDHIREQLERYYDNCR